MILHVIWTYRMARLRLHLYVEEAGRKNDTVS